MLYTYNEKTNLDAIKKKVMDIPQWNNHIDGVPYIMIETIGKCVNHSDKFDIDKLITEDIDELGRKLTNIIHSRKELEEFGVNPDELAGRYESKKSKLKNLLLKVRNTPDCK